MQTRFLVATLAFAAATAAVAAGQRALQCRAFLADPAHRRADDLARRRDRGRRRHPLRPQGQQGTHRPVAVVRGRQGRARTDHAPGERLVAAVQPGRQDAGLRQPARRRHGATAVPAAGRRRRGDAHHQRADRRRTAQVASRRQAHRLPEPRLGRPRHHGGAGHPAEGTHRQQEFRRRSGTTTARSTSGTPGSTTGSCTCSASASRAANR